MTQINPFAGSVLQSTQVQRHQSAERDSQIRRRQELSKNSALTDDRLEHQVESVDSPSPVNPDKPRPPKPKQPKKRSKSANDDENPPHVDLKA